MASHGDAVAVRTVEDALRTGTFHEDPHGLYRFLRETAPVYWSPTLGQWLVTSYASVEEVLQKPRLFSNFGFDARYISLLPADVRDDVATLAHHFQQRGLIQADPPEHTRLRRALGRHFAAAEVAGLEPRIRSAVDSLLDELHGATEFDAIKDLAAPLPVTVIADLLGVPEADRAGFPRWSADAVSFFGTPVPDSVNARRLDADLVEWRELIDRLLRARTTEPQDDLLSRVAALVEEGHITPEEAVFTCVHLLIAGHETTTNLIGNALYCLLRHPAQLAYVREDPARLAGAIEEVLRFEPPIQRIRRVATEPCVLAGMVVDVGEPVIPVLAAANRDPVRFADPDVFDVTRDLAASTQRVASFGHGVHFCLGAPLARIEARTAVCALLERRPGMSLVAGFEPSWRPTINMRSLASLPIQSQRRSAASVS